jgi:hypothetical protein
LVRFWAPARLLRSELERRRLSASRRSVVSGPRSCPRPLCTQRLRETVSPLRRRNQSFIGIRFYRRTCDASKPWKPTLRSCAREPTWRGSVST